MVLIRTQNTLLEEILTQVTEQKANSGEIRTLRERMETIQGTLSSSNDTLRMMSTVMERKH